MTILNCRQFLWHFLEWKYCNIHCTLQINNFTRTPMQVSVFKSINPIQSYHHFENLVTFIWWPNIIFQTKKSLKLSKVEEMQKILYFWNQTLCWTITPLILMHFKTFWVKNKEWEQEFFILRKQPLLKVPVPAIFFACLPTKKKLPGSLQLQPSSQRSHKWPKKVFLQLRRRSLHPQWSRKQPRQPSSQRSRKRPKKVPISTPTTSIFTSTVVLQTT